VTCSKDRTVKIWNYVTKTLEISHTVQEDALAVAFHPSGFHVVVAVQDKIILLNLLSKSLHQFKSLQIKACREIQFSNGGHLFAVANGNIQTQVFNFYTGESPPHFSCRGHVARVRSVGWFPDDQGFVSAGQGGDVYFWDLLNAKDGSTKIMEKDFPLRNVQLSCVVNIPDKLHEVFCCGSDGKIWNNNMPKEPFPVQAVMSQLAITHNGKALFAGVGESGKPGSVVIYKVAENAQNKLKLDKVNEVQAHSKPIERMRLSFDNHQLFTVGQDGCLIIHDVKDRDPKGKQRERECLPFSDEILTEKTEIDENNREIE
jgi:WD40 repeat protein